MVARIGGRSSRSSRSSNDSNSRETGSSSLDNVATTRLVLFLVTVVSFVCTVQNSVEVTSTLHALSATFVDAPEATPFVFQRKQKKIMDDNDDDDNDDNKTGNTETIEGSKNGPKTTKKRRNKAGRPRHPKMRYPFNVTHFFSHIPKTGATYAHGELNRLLFATTVLPGNQSLRDVALAQQGFNASHPELDYFSQAITSDHERITASGAYAPPFVCNEGNAPSRGIKPYYVVGGPLKFRCAMTMTEAPYQEVFAKNYYTIIREPISHVLSQYFHCTESRAHGRPRRVSGQNATKISRHLLMPSLDEWLKTYVDLRESNLNKEDFNREIKNLNKKFRCYNPIESETEYTGFASKEILPPGHSGLPSDYTYPFRPKNKKGGDDHDPLADRDEETKKIDHALFEDLKQRYGIIGDMKQMTKTVCAVVIDYSEGELVPDVCNCKNAVGGSNNHSSGTFEVINLVVNPHRRRLARGRRFSVRHSPLLSIGYDAGSHSHGVKTHGSSHASRLTPNQADLIARLRITDAVLYNISRAVFEEQISEMEARYGIEVCDDWNRVELRYADKE